MSLTNKTIDVGEKSVQIFGNMSIKEWAILISIALICFLFVSLSMKMINKRLFDRKLNKEGVKEE